MHTKVTEVAVWGIKKRKIQTLPTLTPPYTWPTARESVCDCRTLVSDDAAPSTPASERYCGRGFLMLFDDPTSLLFESYWCLNISHCTVTPTFLWIFSSPGASLKRRQPWSLHGRRWWDEVIQVCSWHPGGERHRHTVFANSFKQSWIGPKNKSLVYCSTCPPGCWTGSQSLKRMESLVVAALQLQLRPEDPWRSPSQPDLTSLRRSEETLTSPAPPPVHLYDTPVHRKGMKITTCSRISQGIWICRNITEQRRSIHCMFRWAPEMKKPWGQLLSCGPWLHFSCQFLIWEKNLEKLVSFMVKLFLFFKRISLLSVSPLKVWTSSSMVPFLWLVVHSSWVGG